MNIGHFIIWISNFVLIAFLSARVISVNNDKSPIAFIFGYGIIILLNFIIWGILGLLKAKLAKHMGGIITVIALLSIPLLLILLNI